MNESPRRRNHDHEILFAIWQVKEITEEMDLLDEEVVAEVRAALETDEESMRRVAQLLCLTQPQLENIAIMSEGGQTKFVLLFKDKSATVLRRRRTALGTVRHMIRESQKMKEVVA